MRSILESKRQRREQLAARPFAEKLAILERMRERRNLIAASPLRKPAAASKPSRITHHA